MGVTSLNTPNDEFPEEVKTCKYRGVFCKIINIPVIYDKLTSEEKKRISSKGKQSEKQMSDLISNGYEVCLATPISGERISVIQYILKKNK